MLLRGGEGGNAGRQGGNQSGWQFEYFSSPTCSQSEQTVRLTEGRLDSNGLTDWLAGWLAGWLADRRKGPKLRKRSRNGSARRDGTARLRLDAVFFFFFFA